MDAPAENEDGRLVDTGERCLPWMEDTQVIYEHLHRYYFASLFVADRDVLDVGCGEGYGAAILAESARNVVGVDVVSEVVEHARSAYPQENLQFEVASAVDLACVPDHSVDVVVCFEVIEHVHEQREVVATGRRVLRPDGLFLISTPDRVPYNDSREPNPFHVHELTAVELRELLTGTFRHVALWSQHFVIGSTLTATPKRAGTIDAMAVVRRDATWHRATRSDDYLVAVAAARPLPEVPAFSLLDDRTRSLVSDAVRNAVGSTQTHWQDIVDELEARWRESVAELDGRWQGAVDDLVRQLADSSSESDRLRERAESAEAEVARVTGSRSWRALQRLRVGRR
jgi:2-polyprenyl-3-methyl-5-hydroxy-6-metoxy-1,4-benzoquinol methylase